ncbi:MAG: hypothetical protein Q4D53_08675, partial [Leptotrichiaceae bacterium]|nr:hypothetical protein [Leptotrichiaceae bacterium]
QKKDKTKLQKKTDALLNNQNIEISRLRKENQLLRAQVFENSEKIEELMNFVVNYMDGNETKMEKESSKDLNVSVTDEKKFRNM